MHKEGLMLRGDRVILRAKRLGDALKDHAWRRDPELAKLDATVPSGQSFASFLLDYAEELRLPESNSCRFAIENEEGKHIGNCSYYNLDPELREVEIGILIGDREHWSKGYGTDAVCALLDYLFEEKKVEAVHLRSLDWNKRAHRCFEKAGFSFYDRIYSNGYAFCLFRCKRPGWERARQANGDSGEVGW